VDTLSGAVTVFVACAIAVIIAGVNLAKFGDELAEKTGWGKLWVGTVLVAVSTSLPELTINVSSVWVEQAPGIALGNIFGANMMNVFVIAIVALLFGIRNLFGGHGKETEILVKSGLVMVAVALLLAAWGDMKLGPTSVGAILIALIYYFGMKKVYSASKATEAASQEEASSAAERGSPAKAWVGFLVASAAVIVAGKFLAESANAIATITGLGAGFVGVLLVSMVTTLPEGSVTLAAAMRKSYGMAMGNVYGSCFFNLFIITISESFMPAGSTLLGAMEPSHFVAGVGALGLMTMGFLAMKSAETPSMSLAKVLTPAVPLIYVVLMYVIYTMG
jgi:cation:H+ antiporter